MENCKEAEDDQLLKGKGEYYFCQSVKGNAHHRWFLVVRKGCGRLSRFWTSSLFSSSSVLWGLSLLLWLSPLARSHVPVHPFWGMPKECPIKEKPFSICMRFRAFTLVWRLGVWAFEHSGSFPVGFSTEVKAPIVVLFLGVGRGAQAHQLHRGLIQGPMMGSLILHL